MGEITQMLKFPSLKFHAIQYSFADISQLVWDIHLHPNKFVWSLIRSSIFRVQKSVGFEYFYWSDVSDFMSLLLWSWIATWALYCCAIRFRSETNYVKCTSAKQAVSPWGSSCRLKFTESSQPVTPFSLFSLLTWLLEFQSNKQQRSEIIFSSRKRNLKKNFLDF